MRERWLFSVYFAILAGVVISDIKESHTTKLVGKALLMPSLVVYLLIVMRKLLSWRLLMIILALLLATTGDILLCFDDTSVFITGAACFLSMHICYSIVFFSLHRFAVRVYLCYALTYVLAVSLAVAFISYLHISVLVMLALSLYALVLGSMAISAGRMGIIGMLGATLFAISDTLLGVKKFVNPTWLPATTASTIVMLCYGIAQLMLICGFVMHQRSSRFVILSDGIEMGIGNGVFIGTSSDSDQSEIITSLMTKRRAEFDVYAGEPPSVDRKEEIAMQLRQQLHHAYVFNRKSLVHVIQNKNELNRVLKRIETSQTSHTVHAKHQHIRKTGMKLEFLIHPSKMEPGERCLIPLADFDPAVQSPTELVTGQAHAPVDVSQFLIHNIRHVRALNECPFPILLKSNLWTLVSDYVRTYKQFTEGDIEPAELDRLMGQRAWVMNELPGETGIFGIPPGFNGEVPESRALCMNPVGFMEPEYGRAAYSAVQDGTPLLNGIYFISMPDPNHGHITDFGLLSADHAIAVYARTNWELENLHITAGTHSIAGNAVTNIERFLMMQRSLIESLAAKITTERVNAVPLCDTDRLVFEASRYVNSNEWCSEAGCRLEAGATHVNFDKEYKVSWELELEYTLFTPDIGQAIITIPKFARLLPAPENTKEIEEKVQAEAAQKLRKEEFNIDLAQMNTDDQQQ